MSSATADQISQVAPARWLTGRCTGRRGLTKGARQSSSIVNSFWLLAPSQVEKNMVSGRVALAPNLLANSLAPQGRLCFSQSFGRQCLRWVRRGSPICAKNSRRFLATLLTEPLRNRVDEHVSKIGACLRLVLSAVSCQTLQSRTAR